MARHLKQAMILHTLNPKPYNPKPYNPIALNPTTLNPQYFRDSELSIGVCLGLGVDLFRAGLQGTGGLDIGALIRV